MSAKPFLTDDEILEIVYPLTQPAAIMRWFKNNGFTEVKPRPNGLPLVARAYFDAVQVGKAAAANDPHHSGAATQPNVKAYLDRVAKGAKSGAVRSKV